jgi:signal transduction histidine kinase
MSDGDYLAFGAPVHPVDFRSLFESVPGLYLVLDPEMRIIAATDAYLSATMKIREEIVGRAIFDVFPDNPDDPEATGVANTRASLRRVLNNAVADTMSVQRHDVPQPPSAGCDAGFETRYWSPCNSPVLGPDRQVCLIIHQVEDVTEFVRLQQQGSQAHQTSTELRRRTEQMQAEILRRSRELQEMNVALRAANDAKDEFLSRCSHELRTPLNAILGFSELLSFGEIEAEHKAWAGMIFKAGRHLLALLDDVLDISRIESRDLSLSIEAVPMRPLLTEALDLARPLAAAAEVHLAPAPTIPDDQFVAGDRQRLRQVLLNLLSNAIKYNHPTGTVTTAVEHRPERRLRISVTDTGRGISPEARTKLFTPFERLDAAQAGFEGTGLGLALSRQLVQSMHGTLDVSSALGEGSTFWFELPVADPVGVDRSTTRGGAALAPRTYPTPRRLLYVEDMIENIRLVEQILRYRPAITLIPAMLAGVALDLAREHQPDLILLDLHLPDMPGEQLLARLRADHTTRDIPVVALSADATQQHVDRLLVAGVATYLTKPVAVLDLLRILDDLFDGPARDT